MLSDLQLRRRYDMIGSSGVNPEGGFADPEQIFRGLFGGYRFVEIIGEISIGKLLSDVMLQSELEESEKLGKDEMKKFLKDREEEAQLVQENRIRSLSDSLASKTDLLVDGVYSEEEFRRRIKLEAQDLARESYGNLLLASVGYIYISKAKQMLAKDSFLGIGAFFLCLKEKGNVIKSMFETVSAVRDVARNFQDSDKDPSKISEEKVYRALWKTSELEIQATIRSVCDSILYSKDICGNRDLQRSRAHSLKIIGEIYREVGKSVK